MFEKIAKRYIKKHGLKIVNEKEYENVNKYRSVRGELKKTIDDYNELVDIYLNAASAKELKDFLSNKLNITINTNKKEEIQKAIAEELKKEFKKN